MAEVDKEKGLIFTYDQRLSRYKNKWTNKEERSTVDVVRKRFESMRTGRQNSCPFSNPLESISSENEVTSVVGSDWVDHWDICTKQWIKAKKYVDDNPNIKSATAFAPIEAAMAEFMEGKVVGAFTPTENKDQIKVKLHQHAHDYLTCKASLEEVDAETFHDTCEFGSAIRYVGWFNSKREVELIQSSGQVEKDLKDEGKRKNLQKRLSEDNKPATEKTEITSYDDIGHVRVSLYEFYIDPDARYMRNHIYAASDCIWRQTPTLEQFRAEFLNSEDPWVIQKNVEKVRTASEAVSAYESDEPYYMVPNDINGDSQLELIRYYNKMTDKYIVIANDVVVRDGPIPYNHKELPFVLHKLIPVADCFYGMGLARVVEDIQAESEILRNLKLQDVEVAVAPPLFYDQEYAEDIEAYGRLMGGQKIPLSLNGRPISSAMEWMPTARGNFDYQSMQADLQQEAIQTTGINPIAYSIPKPGEAVRTHMMSMESTLKIIKKYIKFWGYGRKEAMWMDLKLMKQFYAQSYVEEITDGEKETRFRSIRTPGVQIDVFEGKDGLELDETKLVGDTPGFFEMKGEYLDLAGDVDIQLDIDSIVPTSRALQMQKAEQAFKMLVEVLMNPDALAAPGVTTMVKHIIDTFGFPKKIGEELQDTSDEESVEIAMEQDEVMLTGEPVAGVPGESIAHKAQHTQTLLSLLAKLREPAEQPPQLDPMMPIFEQQQILGQYQSILEKKMEAAKANEEIVNILSSHLEEDNTPKQFRSDMALQQAQMLQQAQQMPQGGMPQGQMPPEAGGMGGMPMGPMGPTGGEMGPVPAGPAPMPAGPPM